jgi:hypothetical protein
VVDADELDSLAKVVCLQGQLKNISYENRKPQFGEINYNFVRKREIFTVERQTHTLLCSEAVNMFIDKSDCRRLVFHHQEIDG